MAETKPVDPDEALRVAIKVALDAGDFGRVRALIDVLDPPMGGTEVARNLFERAKDTVPRRRKPVESETAPEPQLLNLPSRRR